MFLKLQPPITYLITSGETTAATRTSSKEFRASSKLVETAVAARINLIQIREKNLTGKAWSMNWRCGPLPLRVPVQRDC